MRTHFYFLMLILVLVVSLSPSAFAQEDNCPAIVQRALAAVDELCSGTGRNQACYGNITLNAEPQEDAESFVFTAPGDITDVVGIRSLTLSPLDESSGEWGVSLMKLQANLPDSLPGQNVTMLLFGDVDIYPAQNLPEISVTVNAGSVVNLRGGPSTSAAVVEQVSAGTMMVASGRDATGDWLRVRLPEGGIGWIFATLVSGEGFDSLAVVTVDDRAFTPMQAFYFRSGVADAPCAAAPDSGILIQTPQGLGEINITINDVAISLGSTAYLQAQPGEMLTVSLVEGQGSISAFDETQIIPAGSQASVPIDDDLHASGPPEMAEPYAEDSVQALPVALLSDAAVTVAEPLTEDEITDAIAEANRCVVITTNEVNLRRGPGTNYPKTGSTAIEGRAPDGQATGTDGMTWYRLMSTLWVRSDVVEVSGDCASLREVTNLPATPAPVTNSNTGYSEVVYLSGACPQPAGQPAGPAKAGVVTLALGRSNAEWKTCEEALERVRDDGFATFTGNGPAATNFRYEPFCHRADHGGYGTNTLADVVLEPGVYTYTGEWLGFVRSCTFTVVR